MCRKLHGAIHTGLLKTTRFGCGSGSRDGRPRLVAQQAAPSKAKTALALVLAVTGLMACFAVLIGTVVRRTVIVERLRVFQIRQGVVEVGQFVAELGDVRRVFGSVLENIPIFRPTINVETLVARTIPQSCLHTSYNFWINTNALGLRTSMRRKCYQLSKAVIAIRIIKAIRQLSAEWVGADSKRESFGWGRTAVLEGNTKLKLIYFGSVIGIDNYHGSDMLREIYESSLHRFKSFVVDLVRFAHCAPLQNCENRISSRNDEDSDGAYGNDRVVILSSESETSFQFHWKWFPFGALGVICLVYGVVVSIVGLSNEGSSVMLLKGIWFSVLGWLATFFCFLH
jgi:hypothetical protein